MKRLGLNYDFFDVLVPGKHGKKVPSRTNSINIGQCSGNCRAKRSFLSRVSFYAYSQLSLLDGAKMTIFMVFLGIWLV